MEKEIYGKVQKINDEDFELINIIETKTYIDAIKWYQENYESSADEAREGIRQIKEKYKVVHKGHYTPDDEEIFFIIEEQSAVAKGLIKSSEIKCKKGEDGIPELIDWYKKRSGCSKEEAEGIIYEKLDEYFKKNPVKSGCFSIVIITIISIASLSLL